jgi:hypothetical protein
MYVHIILYDRRLSEIVLYHAMLSLWSDPILFVPGDPILFSTGDPILFSLGDPILFFRGEPPGGHTWSFPNFKFGGNVISYLIGGYRCALSFEACVTKWSRPSKKACVPVFFFQREKALGRRVEQELLALLWRLWYPFASAPSLTNHLYK